jgi:cell division protein ZapA
MRLGEVYMNSKNKVTVKIMGQEYAIKSNETREYMQRIANLVDDRMAEISGSNKSLSTSMVSILTALTLADDCIKAADKLGNVENRLDNPTLEANVIRDELGALQASYHDKVAECESLSAEFDKLREANREYELEIASLREKYDGLSVKIAEVQGDGKVSGELLKAKNMEIEDLVEYMESLELDKQILKEQLKLKDSELSDVKEGSTPSGAVSAHEAGGQTQGGSDEAGGAISPPVASTETPRIVGMGLSNSIID